MLKIPESGMNKYLIIGIILAFWGFAGFGQQPDLNIPFLENIPAIDGLPDEELSRMEWQSFPYSEKSNDSNPDFATRYKMAYSRNCLYLLIETESDSIVYRDRAYQNGDGFHLVIATPDSGKATDEFYVLRFSPANEIKNIPARKGVWYYNVDLSGKQLSASTQFVSQAREGKCYFELALPWSEVYPYHPLFSGSIGFNLCFVKGIGDKDKNYYFLKKDNRIQSELSKREYLTAKFEPLVQLEKPVSFASVERRNISVGNSVNVKIISFLKSENAVSYLLSVRSADDYSYTSVYKEKQLSTGINSNNFVLPVEKLLPGGYTICWKCSDNSEGKIPFSILPTINYIKEKADLDKLKNEISPGDYNTMLFTLLNLVKDYEKLKTYETAGDIRERFITYFNTIDEIRNNPGYLSEKPGISRRAFLSTIDSTLQPYTIKLPVNFDPHKKYPLFVMLHGSGSDDQGMLDNPLTDGTFIEIAPYGRGTSNCFTTDGAETDVLEAIEDAIKNFPVNASEIIIVGFSMGGYGAYRIYHEYPGVFKGVAVFSGHPSLATQWLGEGYPDFLNPSYLKTFRNTPVFIYHSKNDLNCPYDLTLELVGKLKQAGAMVEFVTTKEGGHGIIDKEYLPLYFTWLKVTIEN
jgi:predicted esterase